jgi:hypothetical protein
MDHDRDKPARQLGRPNFLRLYVGQQRKARRRTLYGNADFYVGVIGPELVVRLRPKLVIGSLVVRMEPGFDNFPIPDVEHLD